MQHEVIGHSGSTGGFRVHRYVDAAGHECAYYDTALLFPTNALSLSGEPTGVAVLDMTDPAKPVRTATLVTPAMQTPARVGEHQRAARRPRRGARQPGVVPRRRRRLRHQPGLPPPRAAVERRPSARRSATRAAWPRRPDLLPDLDRHRRHDRGRHLQPAPAAARSGRYEFNTHGMSVSDDGNRGYFAIGRRPGRSSTCPRSRRASPTRRCARSAG